jgi:cobalt/nickel transport protein
MRTTAIVLVMMAMVVALTPLVMVRQHSASWNGTDGQAVEIVHAVQPEYRPWTTSLWKPPSTEIESLLFSLQAAIGAGALGYALGWFSGRARARVGAQDTEHPW